MQKGWEGQVVKLGKEDQGELQELIHRYGQPLLRHMALHLGDHGLLSWLRDKPGGTEVVLAIRRPSGRLLLHTKAFYPRGVFRLPSGGVEWGESIAEALLREAREETGLGVRIASLLGLIHCQLRSADEALAFTSYIFLLEEADGVLTPDEVGEEITAFKEIGPEELGTIAARLRNLEDRWRDWGRFRAPAHELVAQALASEPSLPERTSRTNPSAC